MVVVVVVAAALVVVVVEVVLVSLSHGDLQQIANTNKYLLIDTNTND